MKEEKETIIHIICAGCGKSVDSKMAKGSLKHPICKKCYMEKFDNNFSKYFDYVQRTHDFI